MEPSGKISGAEKMDSMCLVRRVFRSLISRVQSKEKGLLEKQQESYSVIRVPKQIDRPERAKPVNAEKSLEGSETKKEELGSILQEISVRQEKLRKLKKLKRARDLVEKEEELEILYMQIELRRKLVELKERKLSRKEKELELREELLELRKETTMADAAGNSISTVACVLKQNFVNQPESVGLGMKTRARNPEEATKSCQTTRPLKIQKISSGEVLGLDVPRARHLKTLKVEFRSATKDEVEILHVSLPKRSTVEDLLNEMKTKVELSQPNAELRLLDVFLHNTYKLKIFRLNEKIENINNQIIKGTLRAEEIPVEEKNLGPCDILIRVYHFTRRGHHKVIQNFGEPLLLVIHENETLGEVKLRVQKRMQVPNEEFSKWNFAFVLFGHPKYLQDTDNLFKRFQRRAIFGSFMQYLGLEHPNTPPQKANITDQNHHTIEN